MAHLCCSIHALQAFLSSSRGLRTSGSPALVNFVQIRLRKRITILGIHDQKGGGPWFGEQTVRPRKDQSYRVESLFCLLPPLSLTPRVLRLFQLTPSHTEEALALVAQAYSTVVSIAVAYTAMQRYAVEWPWASELLPSVPLALTELIAADTIPIDRATKLLQDRANTSASLFPLRPGWGA
jgi:hypothetical protein